VKLLFDENLSPKLVGRLSDLFPGSSHISLIGLEGYPDKTIWDRAKTENYTIVSKDNDFRQRAFLFGMPPKVIWLQIGNAGTDMVEALIRRESNRINSFQNDTEEALLILTL
jgi:predicted nuclease of predicted toxin-antitoxin system